MDRPIVIPMWARTGVITLGLDFGTHSTKVILRSPQERRRSSFDKALVLFLDDPDPEYPAFAAPSLVRLCGGKLFFGQRARQGDGHLFSSLKISLLPPPPIGGGEEGAFPEGTTPDLLVALYLSWILSRIKEAVGIERALRLSLNVAAPMNHLENQALRERYLHVVHAAWQATIDTDVPVVTQGAEFSQLRPTFEEFLDRPVPDRKNRRFEILPETLAPLASLIWDAKTRAGRYMMVDMGAGTTEFSVSQLNQPAADGSITCYADKSVRLGGDWFNDNDRRHTPNTEAHTREEKRLKDALLKEFRSVWKSGFDKDKDAGRAVKYQWKQLNIVLAGGGLRRQVLEQAIKTSSPLDWGYFIDPTDYTVNWHHPADLDFDGGQPGFILRDPLDSPAYLAVAHGLSLERQHWPTFYYPGEVETLSSDPRVVNPHKRSYLDSDVG